MDNNFDRSQSNFKASLYVPVIKKDNVYGFGLIK